jgi:hypothetical protein
MFATKPWIKWARYDASPGEPGGDAAAAHSPD